MSREIHPDLVHALMRYEPETGLLFWLPRSKGLFVRPGFAEPWNARWAGKEAFTAVNSCGYKHGCIFSQAYQAHRVCWVLLTGAWPVNDIDHLNGDPRDNRALNLREATRQDNARNQKRRSTNTSGHTGVYWSPRSNKWLATIEGDHIGLFESLENAAKARKDAEVKRGFHPNHGRNALA